MKYMALNGFRHSLDRYFNNEVEIVDRFNWTQRNAVEYAMTIDEPTVLIGFSDGATAALTMANYCPLVRAVYAHSAAFRPEKIVSKAVIHLFHTYGDTATDFRDFTNICNQWTGRTTVQSMSLNPLTPLPVRDLATLVMRLKGHQFHNCLPHLPRHIIKDGWL